MRVCATVNAALGAVALVFGAFAACTGSPPPQPPPAGTDAPTSAPAAATLPPAETTATAAAAGPKKQPESVADCRELLSEITNEPPDGGVVMNNANTSADAGSSDRFAPMVELMKQKRDGFRCCF